MTPFICLFTGVTELSFPGSFFDINSLQPLFSKKTCNEQWVFVFTWDSHGK